MKKYHEFWDNEERSAVDKLNQYARRTKSKIKIVGYQVVGDEQKTCILIEEKKDG